MLLQVADVLTQPETEAVLSILGGEVWRDGAATAAGRAKAAKNNQQADPAASGVKGALTKVEHAVLNHKIFAAAARPAKLARLLFSRYGAGMSYGNHVDAAYIDGVRTDVSFTLFLSPPETYDGGELVIETAGAVDEIKPPAGALVLYPSTAVHRVAPVNSGERIAAVGWIKSRVRSAEARSMLFELETAIAEAAAASVPDITRDRLANVRNNLLRTFGD